MPTLHIRNVPVELYEGLKFAAAVNGRSLNSEVLVRLEESEGSWRGNEEWWRAFEERSKRFGDAVRAAWPVLPSPEEMIRAGRDDR